jgi:hypothetical protein
VKPGCLAALLRSGVWGSTSRPDVVTCRDRQPCMIADVSLPDLQPAAELADTAPLRTVVQGHRAPRPAPRGRRTPQNQPPAPPRLGRPSTARCIHAAPSTHRIASQDRVSAGMLTGGDQPQRDLHAGVLDAVVPTATTARQRSPRSAPMPVPVPVSRAQATAVNTSRSGTGMGARRPRCRSRPSGQQAGASGQRHLREATLDAPAALPP